MTGRRSQPDPSDETTQAAYYGQQSADPPRGQQSQYPVQGGQYQPRSGQQQPPGYPPPSRSPEAAQSVSRPSPAKRRKWPWIVGGLLLVIIIAVSCSNSGSAPSSSTGTSGSAPATQAPQAPAGGEDQTQAKYGQPLKSGDVTITVLSAPKKSSNQFTGSQFCTTVSYQNGGDSPASFNPFDWKFRTAEGVEASASIPFTATKALNSGELRPGGKVQGQVCSDNSATDVAAVVYSGFGFSGPLEWAK